MFTYCLIMSPRREVTSPALLYLSFISSYFWSVYSLISLRYSVTDKPFKLEKGSFLLRLTPALRSSFMPNAQLLLLESSLLPAAVLRVPSTDLLMDIFLEALTGADAFDERPVNVAFAVYYIVKWLK